MQSLLAVVLLAVAVIATSPANTNLGLDRHHSKRLLGIVVL